MNLIENWKEILGGAWSVRLMLVSALLSACPVFFSLVDAKLLGMDPVMFAALAGAASALGILSRVTQQVILSGVIRRFRKDESGWIRRRGIAGITAVSIASVAAFTAPWEGLRTSAYIDLVGVPTVCYGETQGVKLGDTYTPEQCRAMLEPRIAEFRDQLGKCITAEVPEGMAIAFVDWAYNIGTGAACRSTLARKANAGDLFGACDELLKWDKGRINGKLQRIRGLTNRRKAEHDLCVRSLLSAGYSRTGPK